MAPAVDHLSSLMMSSGSSDGNIRLNTPRCSQGISDQRVDLEGSADNCTYTPQTESDLQFPVTHIEDVVVDVLPVETTHVTKPAENTNCKSMYPLEDDSDEESDSEGSLRVSKTKSTKSGEWYSPHQYSSSDEEEVEICSRDEEQKHAASAGPMDSNQAPYRMSPSVLAQTSEVNHVTEEVIGQPLTCTTLVSSTHPGDDSAIESLQPSKEPVSPIPFSINRNTSPAYGDSVIHSPSADLPSDSSQNLNRLFSPSTDMECTQVKRSDDMLSSASVAKTTSTSHVRSTLMETFVLDDHNSPQQSSALHFQNKPQGKVNPAAPDFSSICENIENKQTKEELVQKTSQTESPLTSNTVVTLSLETTTPTLVDVSKDHNVNSDIDFPKVCDEGQDASENMMVGCTLEMLQADNNKGISLGLKPTPNQAQSLPPSTQRTFIEVQLLPLSSLSSSILPHNQSEFFSKSNQTADLNETPVPSLDSPSEERTKLTMCNTLCSTKDTNPTTVMSSNGSNQLTPLKSGLSRLYVKASERRSLSTKAALSADYNPFSVRHKIKSFENLAHFDKPVAKSSDIQSFALTYRASLNQRIAGYMGIVNSSGSGSRTRQRSFSSHVENRNSVATSSSLLAKPSFSITDLGLDYSQKGSSTATPLMSSPGVEVPQTPPVLRRKHGRLSRSRSQQLRALSMPELEKLCTGDFPVGNDTAVNETNTDSLTKAAETGSAPSSETVTQVDSNRLSQGQPESMENEPQKTPDTKAGWSIR